MHIHLTTSAANRVSASILVHDVARQTAKMDVLTFATCLRCQEENMAHDLVNVLRYWLDRGHSLHPPVTLSAKVTEAWGQQSLYLRLSNCSPGQDAISCRSNRNPLGGLDFELWTTTRVF